MFEAEVEGFFREGNYKSYDERGNLHYETSFTHDTINGIYQEFYPSGSLKIQATYSMGEVIGKYFEFYENGEIRNCRFYENGNPVYLKKYDSQGRMVWFALTTFISQRESDGIVYVDVRIPFSDIENVLTGIFGLLEKKDRLDTILGNYSYGLQHSFDFPSRFYDKFDTLVLEVFESANTYDDGVMAKCRTKLFKDFVDGEFTCTGTIDWE